MGSRWAKADGARLGLAMLLYAALLVASLATLSDWRIRLATVAVVLLFAGRTLWQPRRTAAATPLGREADLGGESKIRPM